MARDAGGVEGGVDVRVEVGLEGREGPADAAVHLPGAMERLGVAKASLSATFHSAALGSAIISRGALDARHAAPPKACALVEGKSNHPRRGAAFAPT